MSAMNNLKGIFYTAVLSVLLLVSCGPIENTNTFDIVKLDIYTVNAGSTLTEEFDDSSFTVRNFSDFDLQIGDRVCLFVHGYFDFYNPKNSYQEIRALVEKIPTLTITERGAVNESDYDLPLRSYDYCCQPNTWLWNNRLNVNALFAAKPEATDFVMSLREVRNDTVCLNLLAKSTMPSDTLFTKLLSYDLNNIDSLFTSEERDSVKKHEKLTFRIYMKNKNSKDSLVEQTWGINKGEFVNPLFN